MTSENVTHQHCRIARTTEENLLFPVCDNCNQEIVPETQISEFNNVHSVHSMSLIETPWFMELRICFKYLKEKVSFAFILTNGCFIF